MSLPTSNTTCDIYRNGNGPPAAPDVAGVACLLTPDFAGPHLAAITTSSILRWTHVLLVPPTTDVRDGYQGSGGGAVGTELNPAGADWVFVPDKNGTRFAVIFVERLGRGTGGDVKRVYLQRQFPAWPTNNL